MAAFDMPQVLALNFGLFAVFLGSLLLYLEHYRVELGETQCPISLRAILLLLASLNLGGALVHWLLLPDGGLESIARIELGPPSVARTVAIALQRNEGHGRVLHSVIYIYVAFFLPDYVFGSIILIYVKICAVEIVDCIYQPWIFKGKNVIPNAPGRLRYIPQLLIAAAVAYLTYYTYYTHP